MSLLFLLLVAGLAGLLGGRLPGGFLPEEDQGYMYAGVQLPDASSLQRTSEVCRQIEEIMMQDPGGGVRHHRGGHEHAKRRHQHL